MQKRERHFTKALSDAPVHQTRKSTHPSFTAQKVAQADTPPNNGNFRLKNHKTGTDNWKGQLGQFIGAEKALQKSQKMKRSYIHHKPKVQPAPQADAPLQRSDTSTLRYSGRRISILDRQGHLRCGWTIIRLWMKFQKKRKKNKLFIHE